MLSSTIHTSKYYLLVACTVILFSCEENKRVIEPFVPEGDRIILLEEFTGKGCTNCPKGSREIENLLTLFPENLVVVSIHAGFFANPQFFPIGQFDLRTDEGELLFDYLGPNSGYPAGVVNRVAVNGELQLSANAWASAITQQVQQQPAVELGLVKEYNPDTRELTVTVNGIGKASLSGDIRLSVMLTESGIVDAQDDQEAGGIVQDYVHKHVLRDMLTPATGAMILNSIFSGTTFTRTFTTTLDSGWNANEMEVIAFISNVNGSDFSVLQAVHDHITE